MISDYTLPTKSQLISILKNELKVDYRKFRMSGLQKCIKDKIIVLIYVYHKLFEKEKKFSN